MKRVEKIMANKLMVLVIVLVVAVAFMGGLLLNRPSQGKGYAGKVTETKQTVNLDDAPSFTPTKMEDMKDEKKTGRAIIVFYSNNSDYSKAGAKEILDQAKQAEFPVFYVDFDSPDKMRIIESLQDNNKGMQHNKGLSTEQVSQINTATLVMTDNREYMDRKVIPMQYADQVNGEYVSLTDNIKQAFDTLK
ncbi:hypothetical protein VNN41_09935 [Lactococcus garvieae]|uniref:hypothetical protein n=1 Tax=Lactococcus garvieae TaxID=1363 RepID=UPI00324AC61B